SRARRRIQESRVVPDADVERQKRIVEAYLAAARSGDFDALMSLLDPRVVVRADGLPAELRDAAVIAEGAIKRGAGAAQPSLVNGAGGIVVAAYGRLMMVLTFGIDDEKIVEMEVISDPERLRQLNLAVL